MYANGDNFIENYSSSPTMKLKQIFEFNYTVEEIVILIHYKRYFSFKHYLYVVYFNKFDVSIGPKKHMIVTKQNSHIVRGKLDENLGSIKFEKFYPNEYIEHYGQGHAGEDLWNIKMTIFLWLTQIIILPVMQERYIKYKIQIQILENY